MRHKQMYEYLGVIVSKQSNGLSLFERTENKKRISDRVCGGELGDVVVKDEFEKISIMPARDWQNMPKDEETAIAMMSTLNLSDKEDLVKNLATANEKIAELESRLSKLDKGAEEKNILVEVE